MASITYWNRVVPQPLTTSFENSLAARVRDPAWFLARQLQLGEFLGADAGSPAYVDIGARTASLARTIRPLEPAMEAEPVDPDLSIRVELGQTLETLIDQLVTPESLATSAKVALRTRYPLPAATDPAASDFLSACAGRVSDGAAICGALANGNPPAIDAGTDAALKPVFNSFAAWVKEVFGEIGTAPPANWNAPELAYSLSVDTTLPDGRAATLSAEPDRGADLEWYSFDLKQVGNPGSPAPLVTTSLLPIHVRFRGMPNDRFWDFESNKTEYGAVAADIPDVARLLFLDFMLIHGSGWFVAPLDVPIGAMCQVDSLLVHDVFGGTTPVVRADASLGPPGGRFTFFSTFDATTGGVAAFLFASPTCAPATQRSQPLEDVRLFRDDAAELAWAVEDVAPDALGNMAQGYERGAPSDESHGLPILQYQLQTPVPPAWFALLPGEPDGILIDFIPEPIAGGSPAPWGRIVPSLSSGTAGVPEHAIPRAGLRIQRVFCRSRWIDGSTHLWIARRRLLGARGPSSGLAYDRVIPPA